MTIPTIFFYIFSVILLGSAVMVVSARNTVHSVLFLILAFFNAAALFLLTGAEFLALILVMVYVGAVAVLFMFVVMMLDINISEAKEGLQRYAPVGGAIGLALAAELGLIFSGWHFLPYAGALRHSPVPPNVSNTVAIGEVLYTRYVFLFEMAGLILLVAMIGAIALTLRKRGAGRRQQSIALQNAREPSNTLVMVKAGIGAGMDEVGLFRPLSETTALPGHDSEDTAASEEHGAHAPGEGE